MKIADSHLEAVKVELMCEEAEDEWIALQDASKQVNTLARQLHSKLSAALKASDELMGLRTSLEIGLITTLASRLQSAMKASTMLVRTSGGPVKKDY